jgi:hypothetical protein
MYHVLEQSAFCIYCFFVILNVNSYYFLIQCKLIDFYNVDTLCSLRDADQSIKYRVGHKSLDKNAFKSQLLVSSDLWPTLYYSGELPLRGSNRL